MVSRYFSTEMGLWKSMSVRPISECSIRTGPKQMATFLRCHLVAFRLRRHQPQVVHQKQQRTLRKQRRVVSRFHDEKLQLDAGVTADKILTDSTASDRHYVVRIYSLDDLSPRPCADGNVYLYLCR